MKTRKGEPVIVVPEEQQQIVELERQLAKANTRIETLTGRLEAAQERAEAWEEAALGKEGKAEYDWMEKNRRYNVERAEQVEAERDELQRKLDTCQCETKVLNESLLIEAERERDQLAAELATMREALTGLPEYDADPMPEDRQGYNAKLDAAREALAATPHAAKAAERMRKLEDVLKIARKVISHITHVGFLSATDWEKLEQLRTALDRLDATGVGELGGGYNDSIV